MASGLHRDQIAPGAAGYLGVPLAEHNASARTTITSLDKMIDAGAATQACATLY
ncbi:MAG: hypothetical protein M3143_03940 [Actinomycetota bacterium]|nr:hypothetical protein [Actinomycetota bacterium]